MYKNRKKAIKKLIRLYQILRSIKVYLIKIEEI
jgi:hypothetical protein